jgi:hypothetical protein
VLKVESPPKAARREPQAQPKDTEAPAERGA